MRHIKVFESKSRQFWLLDACNQGELGEINDKESAEVEGLMAGMGLQPARARESQSGRTTTSTTSGT